MAEDNWYSNGNNNWNATNAWNTQADGAGTALSDPDADAHVIIQGSDTITITAAIGNTIKSLMIHAGSSLVGHASHIIETTAEGTASFGEENYAVKINGSTNSDVNITVGGTFDTRIDLDGTMGNLILKGSGEKEFRGTPTVGGNVSIESSCDATCAGAVTINGNLTIASGCSYDTTSAGNHALTVTGITTIGGTLTLNGSTVSLGSVVTAGYAVTMAASGTFNGNSATITMGSIGPSSPPSSVNFSSATTTFTSRNTSASNNITQLGGNTTFSMSSGEMIMTTAAAGNLHFDPYGDKIFDLTINNGGNTVTLVDHLTVDGDLTLTAGELDTGADKDLTVDDSIIIGDGGTLTSNNSAVSLGNLYMMSGSTLVLTSGTTTVTKQGSNATGRTWFTRTDSTDPGPRTLTIPSGSMLMLPNGGTMEFDDSDYYYNITCSGTFETKSGNLHIDNDFRCNGWGPNGYRGYHFTVGNDFTKIGTSTFNQIDTGSTWTVSGNMIIESGKIDVHGRSAPTPGDVNLKLYGNFINNGGDII